MALYHALIESILEDEDAMNKGVADKLKKRKPDDDDRDEYPPAGPDHGLKRKKTREDMGKTDEPPIVKADLKDWFEKPKRPPTPDPEWNTSKTVDDEPTQNWLGDLSKAEKPSKMTGLQSSQGTCKTYVELEYNMEECYNALNDQLDWNNPEGDRYPFDLSKPLPLVLHNGDPKDKPFNGYAKAPYTTLLDPQGVIYKDKLNRKRLRRSNELHKFSDGTLQSVRDTLHDMATNLRTGITKLYLEELEYKDNDNGSHHGEAPMIDVLGKKVDEELGKVCWWKGIRGRP
ncbi:hypothetical protein Tco_0367631 [Tanacetum coccineum]